MEEVRDNLVDTEYFYSSEYISDSDLKILKKLDTWLVTSFPDQFPYDEIIKSFHNVGKHFVAKPLLNKLAFARGKIRAKSNLVYTDILIFLDIILDKYDGTYDYQSYLALPLLELPDETHFDEDVQIHWSKLDWRLVVFVIDCVQCEL